MYCLQAENTLLIQRVSRSSICCSPHMREPYKKHRNSQRPRLPFMLCVLPLKRKLKRKQNIFNWKLRNDNRLKLLLRHLKKNTATWLRMPLSEFSVQPWKVVCILLMRHSAPSCNMILLRN